MEQQAVLKNLKELELKKPSDMIALQIKQLITSGVLKPGARLPAERSFADRFGVGRGHVREALKKLEFLGLLKTLPQSGTYVSVSETKSLEGLISNMLDLEKEDRESLLETRRILEVHAARLAAARATTPDIILLVRVHEAYRKQIREQNFGPDEDLEFHLAVAECSHNSVIKSLIAFFMPKNASMFEESSAPPKGRENDILGEHEAVLQAIKQKEPTLAAEAMEAHMAASFPPPPAEG